MRIRDRYAGEEAVTCVIPGHDRDGEELVADELRVDDGPLAFDFSGTCGYAATFAYSGDERAKSCGRSRSASPTRSRPR